MGHGTRYEAISKATTTTTTSTTTTSPNDEFLVEQETSSPADDSTIDGYTDRSGRFRRDLTIKRRANPRLRLHPELASFMGNQLTDIDERGFKDTISVGQCCAINDFKWVSVFQQDKQRLDIKWAKL